MTYDTLMRLPFLAWVIACAVIQAAGLIQHTHIANIDTAHGVHITARVSTILFLLLLATAVLARSRPSAKASGLEPRISALAGTFLIYGIAFFPRLNLSLPAEAIATSMTIVGTVSATIALYQLGKSFSIMAESRQLVTTGVYGWVRHPLYLVEEIAALGVFLQFASVWTAMIFAAQIAFQLRRIHNEEAVLSAAFPEYAIYQGTTARLLPGVY